MRVFTWVTGLFVFLTLHTSVSAISFNNIIVSENDTPPPLTNFSSATVCFESDVFDIPEVWPSFKGGGDARKNYFKNKISKLDLARYKDSLPRTIWVALIIDTLGIPQDIKIAKGGFDSLFNQQIIKIAQQMPPWIPGRVRQAKVKTRIVISIKLDSSLITASIPSPPHNNPYARPESITEDIIICDFPIMPRYVGGDTARVNYFSKSSHLLDLKEYYDSFPRTVYAELIINATGKPTNVKIVRGGLDSVFNMRIINAVNEMPDWLPGEEKGHPVRVKIRMPIKFLRKE